MANKLNKRLCHKKCVIAFKLFIYASETLAKNFKKVYNCTI